MSPPVIRLEACNLLDPRPSEEAMARPIRDSVNIPYDELAARSHELPPRERLLHVANVFDSGVFAALALLKMDRAADLTDTYTFCDQDVASGTARRLWEPNAFLSEVAPQLQSGRAMDVACGTGRDAVWLASNGWQVVGVDVLPDALSRARDLERRYLRHSLIAWRVADVEAPEFAAGIKPEFDLITIFRFLDRPLFARLAGCLRLGGSLVYETFTTVHQATHGKPRSEAFVLKPGELRELLAGWELVYYSEDWRGDGQTHTARAWARRPSLAAGLP